MKKRIISAFKDLSQVKGLKNITMDELAAHAGISKKTIYRYFKSKEEIIEAVLESFIARTTQKFESILTAEEKPTIILRRLIEHISYLGHFINPLIMRDMQQHYPHFFNRIEKFRTAKLQYFFEALLKKSNGQYFRDIDPRIITTTFLASIQALLNPNFILHNQLTFEKTASQLVDLLMYGFVKKEES